MHRYRRITHLLPGISWQHERFVHSLIFSANYNIFSSVDKTLDNLNDTKSNNYLLNYQITVVPRNLTYTFNLNYTDVKSAAYEDGNYGITLGVNKVMNNSKLTMGWLGSFLKGLHGKSTGLILNQNVTVSYRINKHHGFGTTVSYINNRSQQSLIIPSYSEWQADLNYRYVF